MLLFAFVIVAVIVVDDNGYDDNDYNEYEVENDVSNGNTRIVREQGEAGVENDNNNNNKDKDYDDD